MDKEYMTPKGYKLLEESLSQLMIDRKDTAHAIEEARMHGDLSENAEYHAAKERQGFIFGKIAEVEGKLARAEVVDPTSLSGDRVVFASTVTILDCDTDKEQRFQIVGEDEADFKQNKLSIKSPIVRGIIGHEVEDVCYVELPGGEKEFEILKVEFI